MPLSPLLIALLPAAATQDAPPLEALEPGLTFRVYEAGYPLERELVPQIDQSPNFDELRQEVLCSEPAHFGGFEDYFVVVVTAWLAIDAPGRYLFRTTSDDGSYLEIGGEQVLWNSGLHAPQAREGAIELEPGLHPLRLLMFENEGGQFLSLEWRPPGAEEFSALRGGALFTERGVTRVVAPGPKLFDTALGDLTPGDGLPLEACHPAWRVRPLRPAAFQPKVGALAWLPDGRLGVACFDPKNDGKRQAEPNGTLYALSNLGAEDPEQIQVETVAEGFVHPLGMVARGEWLYLVQREEVTRLRDGDGDGSYEVRETFARGWTSDNYHHFTFGAALHGEHLYATLSTSIGSEEQVTAGAMVGINGPNPERRGTLLRIDLREGLTPEERVEYLAGGFRTPNGLLVLGDGTVLVADNQGAWKPASRIDHVRPGHFYGHYNETRVHTATSYPEGGAPALFAEQPETPPALWLPQGEVANSPTELIAVPSGPFAGQVLFGELKLGGIRRAQFETVDGVLQGAAFRFCQGFEGGVNRLLWAPDGSLLVGMTGESATWSWRGTTFGLQRLEPTGASVFEFHSVSATPSGFRLSFTEPVDAQSLAALGNYRVRQWRYRATPEYGGSKLDEEELTVAALRPADDGRSVELDVPGLREGFCVWLRAGLESAAGQPLWSPECWYTLNRIPGRARPQPPAPAERGVLLFSKTAGFRHDSIEEGLAALESIAAELGLPCEATEDAAIFDDGDLQRFRAVVFLSTTGDVLDLRQEAALERWIRAGGGFLGVHAAADTEYDWPFYRELVGAFFRSHPAVQEARLEVLDRTHPATAHLPEVWVRTDEWYDYRAAPDESFRVLLRLDEESYSGGQMTAQFGQHPIAWAREFGPARVFYTGLGHTAESFAEPDFLQHLSGALRYVARLAP
jgi:type 1 glutamine amidotransferase